MFAGFNRRKKGSVSDGDWDRDGVKNRRDCNAMDHKRQDGGEPFKERFLKSQALKEYDLKMEQIVIKERLEEHRLKNKAGGKK